MKKTIFTLWIIMGLLFMTAFTTSALTTEEKITDFQALYNYMEGNSPLIWLNQRKSGLNWLDNKDRYKTIIAETDSDIEYYHTLNQILGDFNNGHTHIVSPSYYEYLRKILSGEPWHDILYNGEVKDAYNKWSEILRKDGSQKEWVDPDRENVNTEILRKDEIAYLDIDSFSRSYYEGDRTKIYSFLHRIRDYQYLIIDIRGNGGGTDLYWKENLVAPLIDKPLMANFYLLYRSGEYTNRLVDKMIGSGKAFMRVGRRTLTDRFNFPDEINTYRFMDPLKVPYLIMPEREVDFQGQIILLVDEGVYSSAETFAAFAGATDWATLIGTKTGGAGIGLTPQLFKLPESNLLVRTQTTIGVNSRGQINEEYPTEPDIVINKPDLDLIDYTVDLISGDNLPRTEVKRGNYFSNFFRDYDGRYGYPVEEDYSQYRDYIIEEIKIAGIFNTAPGPVKKILGFQEGDRFNPAGLKIAENYLEDLDSQVGITFEVIPAGEKKVKVVLFMEEGTGFVLSPDRLTRRVIDDMLNKQISYKHYNIAGKMINAKFTYGFGDSKNRVINVTFPQVFAGRGIGRLNIGTFNQGMNVSDHLFPGTEYQFSYRYLNLAHESYLTEKNKLVTGLTFLEEDLLQLAADNGPPLSDADYTDLSLNLISPDYQLKGGLLSGRIESEGNYPYLSLMVEKQTEFNNKWLLSLNSELGLKDRETPYNHLYHPEGYEQMAAYTRNQLTGSRMFFNRAELRRKLINNLSLSLIGEVIYLDHTVNGEKKVKKAADTALALEYEFPVGVKFRTAYGVSLTDSDRNRFYLGLTTEY